MKAQCPSVARFVFSSLCVTAIALSATGVAQADPPRRGIVIPGNNRPPVDQNTTRDPYLAEAPNQTFLDPCSNMNLDDIGLQQEHDGVHFRFNGGSAEYSALYDLFYEDRAGSTYTCQKNSQVANVGNPVLVFDYGWTRSGAHAGDMNGRLSSANAYLNNIEASGEHSNACYLCGLMRNNHGCFPPGVHVATDGNGGTKLVEDVAVGDFLWNPILGRSAKVLRVVEGGESLPLVSFGFGQTTLSTSQQHPVLTDRGIKMAKNLTLADSVYTADGTLHALEFVSLLPVDQGQSVINFILESHSDSENERMILADGIVTGDLAVQRALAKISGE